MSEMSTLFHAGLLQYLVNHTTPESAFMGELREAAHAAGFAPIAIAPEQGVFIQVLLAISGAKSALDVGTLYGYSALTLAEGLGGDGTVDTIDVNPESQTFTAEWFAKSDVGHRISFHLQPALDWMKAQADGSYDAIFIDANKDHYIPYMEESLRLLPSGGLLMVDNAFAYGQLLDDTPVKKDDVWAIRAFNDRMAQITELQGVIVPIGDGMWIARKQ